MEFKLDWPVLRQRLRNVLALVGLAVFFDRILLALQELFTKEVEDNSIDYVLVFSAIKDGSTEEERVHRANQQRLILAGIVQSGLSVEQVDDSFWNSDHKKDDDLHLDDDARVTVYAVTATFETLVKGAELFRVRKAVRHGGKIAFKASEARKFEAFREDREFFTPSERQRIVRSLLLNVRSRESAEAPVLLKALHAGVIQQMFTLSNPATARKLLQDWTRFPGAKPLLERVADYFGTEIAFSFAWLDFYTWFLRLPAFIGVITYLLSDGTATDTPSLLFATFMSMSVTIFLELWKRQASRLRCLFSSEKISSDELERSRPEFLGEMKRSEITGKRELFYPSWKRNMKTLATIPPMLLMVLMTVLVMLASFEAEKYVEKTSGSSFLVYFPSIVFGVLIPLLNKLYSIAAVSFTKWENHRTESSYQTALILRLVLLKFNNCFLSLFYVLFYLQDMARLRQQLATLLITSQITGQLSEVGVPIFKGTIRAVMAGKSSEQQKVEREIVENESVAKTRDGMRIVPAAEAESVKEDYPGTFDDYLEMVIQFGYVFLFGWSWPLAPLAALLNNITESRTDMFKLCYTVRKPAGHAASGIGPWYLVLECMSVLAVVVNCSYLAVFMYAERETFMPQYSLMLKFILIVLAEHVFLTLKVLLAVAIKDKPSSIRMEEAKDALKNEEQNLKLVQSPNTSAVFKKKLGYIDTE